MSAPFDIYTDDQLVAGVSNALAANDLEAVEAIMLVLAGQNAHRAQDVFDTMRLGTLLAKDAAALGGIGNRVEGEEEQRGGMK